MVLLIKDNGEDQLLDLLVAHQTIRATVDCVATFTGVALIVAFCSNGRPNTSAANKQTLQAILAAGRR